MPCKIFSLTAARLILDPKLFATIFYSFMTKLLPFLPEERDVHGMAFLAVDDFNLPLDPQPFHRHSKLVLHLLDKGFQTFHFS